MSFGDSFASYPDSDGEARPGIQEKDGRTNVHPVCNGREAAIRIFTIQGSLLLDITEDEIEWPDDHFPKILETSDALTMCKLDELYIQIYPLGKIRTANSVLTLSWGCDYQAVRTACPRCTVCSGPCERTGMHILCAHSPPTDPARGVHLWHDLRCRVGAKRQLGNTSGIRVSCQGYHDGACWEEELSKAEIEIETIALLREWCSGADAERGRVAAHAWKARVPTGHLRNVLVRAISELWPTPSLRFV